MLSGDSGHMVLADQGLDELRGRLRSDAVWSAFGLVTAGTIFVFVAAVALWEFLGSQAGLEVLRWVMC